MYTLFFAIIIFFFSTPLYGATSSLTFQELNKFTSSIGRTDDYFAISVAVNGDTAVVGSYGEYATIFERNSTTGIFEQRAILRASDSETYDAFGGTIGISGDTVVVGAYKDDCPSGDYRCGSAYIFEKPVSGWGDMTESAKLTASDSTYMDSFGWRVGISGDTVVVVAIFDECADGRANCGSAYIYQKPVSGWATTATQTAKLTAFDDDSFLYFGYEVAISGDTIVVGTPYDISDTYSGSAYLFVKPASGWINATQNTKLITSDAMPNSLFGCSVAISGDTVLVGGITGKNGAGISAGSAYIFEKPITGWDAIGTESAKLTASDGEAEDFFGVVAINKDLVVVGAFEEDEGGGENAGSAYVFEKPPTGWVSSTENRKLIANGSAVDDNFGYSIAISGYTVIIGEHSGMNDSGSAHIFEGKPFQKILPGVIMYLLSE